MLKKTIQTNIEVFQKLIFQVLFLINREFLSFNKKKLQHHWTKSNIFVNMVFQKFYEKEEVQPWNNLRIWYYLWTVSWKTRPWYWTKFFLFSCKKNAKNKQKITKTNKKRDLLHNINNLTIIYALAFSCNYVGNTMNVKKGRIERSAKNTSIFFSLFLWKKKKQIWKRSKLRCENKIL